MKSLLSTKASKEKVRIMKQHGVHDLEILKEMFICYIKRFIGIRQLKSATMAMGWKTLPKTAKATFEEVYSIGFKAPRNIALKIDGKPNCVITIELNMKGEDDESFEEM